MSEREIIKYLKNSIDEKGNYCYSLPVETTKTIIKELNRLNNIINELEKWLNEYYKSNRKWYNTELSNHDKQYYEEIYRNTEFMIVKFLKQLKELKENK